MSKKTDWDIIRGLADYIVTFGEHKFDKYDKNGNQLPYHTEEDNICLYVSGSYVSCTVTHNGEETKIDVHDNSFDTPDLCYGQNMSDIVMPDVRKTNKLFRKWLKPLEKNRDQVVNAARLERIKNLKKQLKELQNEQN